MPPRLDVCLFDIDGTLINGGGAGRRAFQAACHAHVGRPNALDGVRLDGKTDPAILDEVFRATHGRAASDDEQRAVFADYVQRLGGELAASTVEVLPGVEAALDWLRQLNVPFGLATGNLEAGARLKLERAALWHHFAFGGFGSDAAERAELVRIGVRRGEARLGRAAHPAAVLVLGDTPLDMLAAQRAGVRGVGVATGSYSVDELRAAGADEAYATLTDWLAAQRLT